MFRDSSSLSMFTPLTFISSLYFTNYSWFSFQLLFTCLICLVSVMICMFNSEKIFYGMFEDCIGIFNSHYHSLLCQNLYQVIPLFLWQFSKTVKLPFHHKLEQHSSQEFIFNIDVRCVSCKFTTYLCLHLCQK